MTESFRSFCLNAELLRDEVLKSFISAGRVTVNGKIAAIGQQADAATDQICVDGTEIGQPPGCEYLLLNKPKGICFYL